MAWSGAQACGTAQVEGDGDEGDLGCRLGQAEIAGADKAHPPLPDGEGGLDRGASAGDQPVEPGQPLRQLRMVPVGPAHDPRLDARGVQALAPRLGIVGHVGIDRLLVAADQKVGRHGVFDVGGRGDERPDQARALVDPDMGLVTERRAWFAPARTRVALKTLREVESPLALRRRRHRHSSPAPIMARPSLEVADILNRHGEAYLARHRLSRGQLKVMGAIQACRTAALGGHVMRCGECDRATGAYNSCRNRHCPRCQGAAAKDWLVDRQADLLPVPYYHLVFTLPAPVAAIAFQNKTAVYGLLFRVAAETLSATAIPAAPCFRMNAFWASENFESFIFFRSSQPMRNDPENSNSKRSSSEGPDHGELLLIAED